MWPVTVPLCTLACSNKNKIEKKTFEINNMQDYMSNGTRSNRVSESQLARTEYGHDAVIVI